MNDDLSTPGSSTHDDTLPDALRWQLRGLRTDRLPGSDLWPGIAQRIASLPQQQPVSAPRRDRSHWRPGLLAAAASILVAFGIGWQFRSASPDVSSEATLAGSASGAAPVAVLPQAARAMTVEYRAAIIELDATRQAPLRDPALRELDRSAADVRTALARDPEARYLLDRLQSLYARRLALTQRLAMQA